MTNHLRDEDSYLLGQLIAFLDDIEANRLTGALRDEFEGNQNSSDVYASLVSFATYSSLTQQQPKQT